jgi:hypothetical protein
MLKTDPEAGRIDNENVVAVDRRPGGRKMGCRAAGVPDHDRICLAGESLVPRDDSRGTQSGNIARLIEHHMAPKSTDPFLGGVV